ncbi:MAG: response regulator [Verrucomicrobiota bacterium]
MATRKVSVLVIDDQDDNCSFFRNVLTAHGYACDCARGGQEGLVKLSEKAYDVVFLDLFMPGIDGEAILSWLRSRLPRTSVVISSVQDDHTTMRQMLVAGATAYLIKPLTPEQVLSVMRGIENRRTAAGLDLVASG